MRLCGFGSGEGGPAVLHTFEGTYPEAEAFAQAHGLAFDGVRAAVSHVPFKLEAVEAAVEGSEEDIHPQLERVKPPGLNADAFDAQAFFHGEDRYLLIAREDAVKGFTEKLPASLGSLWALETPLTALLPFMDSARALGQWVSILAEDQYVHLLFFRGTAPIAYAKSFSGWKDARRDPAAFSTEMKKALVYHFGSRFPGAALDSIQIWRDGPGGEIASSLKGLGIPQFDADWGPLSGVTDTFRVAAALALRGMGDEGPMVSFSVPLPAAAESRRVWRRRSGKLARVGFLAMSAAGIGVAMLALSAVVLHWTVSSKARAWSGELQRWGEFQKQKQVVEAEVNGIKGLFGNRTDGYAGLQGLASSLPSEVWLESWELENTAGRRFTHRLEGYTLAEGRIPEFLSNLEKSGRFQTVKLKSTERIKGETVEEKTKIHANRKDLVRFQIGAVE